MNTKDLEIEIKFAIEEKEVENIKKKIAGLRGVLYLGKKYEKSIMFDNEQCSMHSLDACLRVRLIGNKNNAKKRIEFCFKKRLSTANGIKKEQEIDANFIANAKNFINILNQWDTKKQPATNVIGKHILRIELIAT